MGRPKGTIRKPRLIPAEWLSFYTRYVKRALEERGVPECNQPSNDHLIGVLIARLSDWLDWGRINDFIASEARRRDSYAFEEEGHVSERQPLIERKPARSKRKPRSKHNRAAG